jgi:hypothetical protein
MKIIHTFDKILVPIFKIFAQMKYFVMNYDVIFFNEN